MSRTIRLVTTAQQGRFLGSPQANADYMASLLDSVWAQQPDIVCLPENFLTVGQKGTAVEKALPLDNPHLARFAALAREHRSYIVFPLTTLRDGCAYNSAVILDRDGGIAGIYDKAQPVTSTWDYSKLEHGMTPGPLDVPVFDLDFGRIGIQICFDIEFPETWATLAGKGAELVFWPSAYNGGEPLAAYAQMHNYYVVSSVRTEHSRIINPLGQLLDETSRNRWACRDLDLDFVVVHNDFHNGLFDMLGETYGSGIRMRQTTESGKILIESACEKVPLAEIIERFGIVSRREYIDRHRQVFPAFREGRVGELQNPRFAGRAPYTNVAQQPGEAIGKHRCC